MKHEFTDTYTKERLSLYPTPFRALSKKSLKTADEKKLKKQQEKFAGRYICPLCKQPKTWIKDTNIMSCTNSECKGFAVTNVEGEIIDYKPVYSTLSTRGEEIAATLYTE